MEPPALSTPSAKDQRKARRQRGAPWARACTHLSMFQGPSFIRAAGVLVTMSQDYVAAGVALDMRAEDAGASSTGQQAFGRFCPWTGQSRRQVSSLKPLREDAPLGAGPCHTRAQRDAHHGTATLSHLLCSLPPQRDPARHPAYHKRPMCPGSKYSVSSKKYVALSAPKGASV